MWTNCLWCAGIDDLDDLDVRDVGGAPRVDVDPVAAAITAARILDCNIVDTLNNLRGTYIIIRAAAAAACAAVNARDAAAAGDVLVRDAAAAVADAEAARAAAVAKSRDAAVAVADAEAARAAAVLARDAVDDALDPEAARAAAGDLIAAQAERDRLCVDADAAVDDDVDTLARVVAAYTNRNRTRADGVAARDAAAIDADIARNAADEIERIAPDFVNFASTATAAHQLTLNNRILDADIVKADVIRSVENIVANVRNAADDTVDVAAARAAAVNAVDAADGMEQEIRAISDHQDRIVEAAVEALEIAKNLAFPRIARGVVRYLRERKTTKDKRIAKAAAAKAERERLAREAEAATTEKNEAIAMAKRSGESNRRRRAIQKKLDESKDTTSSEEEKPAVTEEDPKTDDANPQDKDNLAGKKVKANPSGENPQEGESNEDINTSPIQSHYANEAPGDAKRPNANSKPSQGSSPSTPSTVEPAISTGGLYEATSDVVLAIYDVGAGLVSSIAIGLSTVAESIIDGAASVFLSILRWFW